MTFGKRLSTLRNARQLTQGALAAALEVSQPKYNKWENDINRPNYEMVAALARYFGTTTDYLLGLDEQPARAQSDVYTLTGLEPRTKAGMPSGANGGAATAVIDDSTSHITICGGAGEQVKSIVKALRGLADALETLTEVEG